MSAHNIELAAKVSAYASNFELIRAWPALRVLTHVVDGGIDSEQMAASHLDEIGQSAEVPAYSDWRTTPDAETAIAERVQLQEEYETNYTDWLSATREGRISPYFDPGMSFVAFELPEQKILKLTLSNPMPERATQVHGKSDALIVVSGLHAALEQIRAMSFWDGGIVTDLARGAPPDQVTAETVKNLTPQNVDDAFEAIKLASDRHIKFDDVGDNIHVAAPDGFAFFDFYRLGRHADTDELFRSNCRGFWRRGIGILGDRSVQLDPESKRQRIAIITRALQKFVDLGITPYET